MFFGCSTSKNSVATENDNKAFEKLRIDIFEAFANGDLQIEEQLAGNLCIAPFILMPFIENAFKHVSKRKEEPNWINMQLHFDKQELHFDISNSVSAQYNSSNELPDNHALA